MHICMFKQSHFTSRLRVCSHLLIVFPLVALESKHVSMSRFTLTRDYPYLQCAVCIFAFCTPGSMLALVHLFAFTALCPQKVFGLKNSKVEISQIFFDFSFFFSIS